MTAHRTIGHPKQSQTKLSNKSSCHQPVIAFISQEQSLTDLKFAETETSDDQSWDPRLRPPC